MNYRNYDVVIIGSGIAGLYSAYNLKKMNPCLSFIVLEKHKKQWIGGRTSNETFYGTEIVTGAGVGRKKKDKLLIQLMEDLHVNFNEFDFNPIIASTVHNPVNIKKILSNLKKRTVYANETFEHFLKKELGEEQYKNFLITNGYTDYEHDDAFDVIENYGLEDNYSSWKGLTIHWKKLILALTHSVGINNIRTSCSATNIFSFEKGRYKKNGTDYSCDIYDYCVETDNNITYYCNKIIVATTITSLRTLFPRHKIYDQIEGQPFLRLYAKFSKSSCPILKDFVKGYTIVPGPLQKIIPIDANKGVYMIAYSDNKNAEILKKHLTDTEENREMFASLVEKSLGIPTNTVKINALKDFYWPIGTHYYKPLDIKMYGDREEFIYRAQHPDPNVIVVGEVVASNQGWTEGALESVKKALTKSWLK
jgi:hypothetical protein